MPKYRSRLLEQDHAIEVLLMLRGLDKMPLMELHEAIAISRLAVGNRLEELAKAGLIKIEIVKDPKRRRMISLTPLGREIANHLAEIERLIRK